MVNFLNYNEKEYQNNKDTRPYIRQKKIQIILLAKEKEKEYFLFLKGVRTIIY